MNDKVKHFLAGAAIGAAWLLFVVLIGQFEPIQFVWAVVMAALGGGVKEGWDWFHGRKFDFADIAYTVAGGSVLPLVVVLFVVLLSLLGH